MQFCFVLFNVRVSSLFADFMTCLWDPKQTASPGAVGVECLECVGPYLEQVLLSICVVQCSRDLPNEFQNFQPGQVKVVVMSGYINPSFRWVIATFEGLYHHLYPQLQSQIFTGISLRPVLSTRPDMATCKQWQTVKIIIGPGCWQRVAWVGCR